jgi:predicted transcriptional regulator
MLPLAEWRFEMERNTMAYSLGQAAKAAGISKTSLHRADQDTPSIGIQERERLLRD